MENEQMQIPEDPPKDFPMSLLTFPGEEEMDSEESGDPEINGTGDSGENPNGSSVPPEESRRHTPASIHREDSSSGSDFNNESLPGSIAREQQSSSSEPVDAVGAEDVPTSLAPSSSSVISASSSSVNNNVQFSSQSCYYYFPVPNPMLPAAQRSPEQSSQTQSAQSQGFRPPVLDRVVKNKLPISLIADKYLILHQIEGTSLHSCVNVRTKEHYVCKVLPKQNNANILAAHYKLDSEESINKIQEVIVGDKFVYLMFMPSHGDLHSYVRQKKRIKEEEARNLFHQIAQIVNCCHEKGIVLRDLKLRKFAFADPEKTKLKLESLDDAVVLENGCDLLHDKRGCPAYVSPEILRVNATYSGKAADMWSLGVILYTMLVGRYPFNDLHHTFLFAKITAGYFAIPEHLASKARCLIRSLLRRCPEERLTASEVVSHPWFRQRVMYDRLENIGDQVVPSYKPADDEKMHLY